MPDANAEEASSEEPTLALERTFDCSPERLWVAWTDPAQSARWLNPAPGLDLVVHEWDLRPGGRVRFDVPQPDDDPNPQEGVFHELDPPRRLVAGEPDRSFRIEATFEPDGEKTRMVVQVTGVPPELREQAIEGQNASFDKLEALVTGQAPPIETRSITIERLFDCSPQALWDAWTTPELLARWFGPFPEAEVESMEIREGGKFRLAMVDSKGERYPVWGEYQELDPPRSLVFKAQALEIGDQVSTVRVEIEPEGERTRMRLTQSGLPVQVADGTGEGWQAAWDKLGPLVAEGEGSSP